MIGRTRRRARRAIARDMNKRTGMTLRSLRTRGTQGTSPFMMKGVGREGIKGMGKRLKWARRESKENVYFPLTERRTCRAQRNEREIGISKAKRPELKNNKSRTHKKWLLPSGCRTACLSSASNG